MCSGICGGYTGSYIFSQTIIQHRQGIDTQTCSMVIALCQLVALLLPIPYVSYAPKMLFGALLQLIAIDLMKEWLVRFFHCTLIDILLLYELYFCILDISIKRFPFHSCVDV
jgi:MFS superfamily sulfate permease-like transporter